MNKNLREQLSKALGIEEKQPRTSPFRKKKKSTGRTRGNDAKYLDYLNNSLENLIKRKKVDESKLISYAIKAGRAKLSLDRVKNKEKIIDDLIQKITDNRIARADDFSAKTPLSAEESILALAALVTTKKQKNVFTKFLLTMVFRQKFHPEAKYGHLTLAQAQFAVGRSNKKKFYSSYPKVLSLGKQLQFLKWEDRQEEKISRAKKVAYSPVLPLDSPVLPLGYLSDTDTRERSDRKYTQAPTLFGGRHKVFKDQKKSIAPVKQKPQFNALDKFYQEIREIYKKLNERKGKTIFVNQDFELGARDLKLIASWNGFGDHNPPHLEDLFSLFANEYAKKGLTLARAQYRVTTLVSARVAELVAIEYYKNLGRSAEDMSITQLDGNSQDWKSHDLSVNGKLVDVKNARTNMDNSNYSEQYIKEFKRTGNFPGSMANQDIRYLGMLSDYSTAEDTKKWEPYNIRVLGEVSQPDLLGLQDWVNHNYKELIDISIYQNRSFIPGWAFEYPDEQYIGPEQYQNWIDSLIDRTLKTKDNNLKDKIPIWLIMLGKKRNQISQFPLTPFQLSIWEKLQDLRSGIGLTRRSLYLLILCETLAQINKENSEFKPESWNQIIFHHDDIRHPLGLYDVQEYIFNLIDVLNTICSLNKQSLKSFKTFKLANPNILQGRLDSNGQWRTIIAYCGGWRNIGKCGKNPIYIGDSSSCPKCAKLICSACGFCSKPCEDNNERQDKWEEPQVYY